ncbi:MAG: phosphatase PAP2 family protein [bacterium]
MQRKSRTSLYLVMAVGAIGLAFVLGALRNSTGVFDAMDTRTSEIADSLRSIYLTPVMRGISWLGYEAGLMVVICVLYWLGYTAEAVTFALMVLFGLALNSMMKDLFELPRPPESLISRLDDPGGYGYPSGHGQWGVLYAWLAISLVRGFLPGGRGSFSSKSADPECEPQTQGSRPLWLCLLPVPLLIASRLYLGVHYLTDTIGGLICGLGLVLGVSGILAYLRDSSLREPFRRSLALKLLLSLALSAGYFGLACTTPEAFRYAALGGFLLGFVFIYSALPMRWHARNLPLAVAVVVIGLSSMMGLRRGLAAVLPESNLGACCRYLVIGACLAVSPLLFTRMRLLEARNRTDAGDLRPATP